MVQVGDRVEVESEKVGQRSRSGVVMGLSGRLLRIRWDDGSESSFMPQAGSLKLARQPRKTVRRKKDGR